MSQIQILRQVFHASAEKDSAENTAKMTSAPIIRIIALTAGAVSKTERKSALVIPAGTGKSASATRVNKRIQSSISAMVARVSTL